MDFFKKIFKKNERSLEILEKAIIEYRLEGKELMFRLGSKFGYDISIKEQFEELIRKGNTKVPRKGKISERVNYSFHGSECHFHKKKTQQNIEVILCNSPNFGKIDAWFLKSYLNSTTKYKKYSKDLEWSELKQMIKQLYNTGKIKEV